eukprot:m51a1_g13565 putative C-tail anchored protein (147) ;mRNA; f:1206-1754
MGGKRSQNRRRSSAAPTAAADLSDLASSLPVDDTSCDRLWRSDCDPRADADLFDQCSLPRPSCAALLASLRQDDVTDAVDGGDADSGAVAALEDAGVALRSLCAALYATAATPARRGEHAVAAAACYPVVGLSALVPAVSALSLTL